MNEPEMPDAATTALMHELCAALSADEITFLVRRTVGDCEPGCEGGGAGSFVLETYTMPAVVPTGANALCEVLVMVTDELREQIASAN